MNILVGFNDSYVIPARVMLKSLICNNDCFIKVFVLYDELSDESINFIRSLESSNYGSKVGTMLIEFIKVKQNYFDCFPTSTNFPKEVYYRLFAQHYLDDSLDRILWLDSDIIVNGSIEELYNIDFDNNYYVAVEDQINGYDKVKHQELQIPLDKPYVNTGVLLINLSLIKREVCVDRIFKYINSRKIIEWPDQDTLNALFYEKCKVINDGYCYNYFCSYMNPKNIEEILNRVKIVHYCGIQKPWKRGYIGMAFDLWWYYALLGDSKMESYYKKMGNTRIKGIIYQYIKMWIVTYIPWAVPLIRGITHRLC